MINVLIADDSPTLRGLIRLILESDPQIKVVGEARNGKEAIELCQNLNPDLITMDINMPKMNGYTAIKHIMSEMPRPIIVLTTTQSDLDLGISYKSIEYGALMVFGKPHGLPGMDPEADQLINLVKAMSGVKVIRRHKRDRKEIPEKGKEPVEQALNTDTIKIIAIGASTGGPPALQTLLKDLSIDIQLPIAVVQHISKGFVKGLARWLNETTSWRVKVAENRETIIPATVYLAPDDQHFTVDSDGRVLLENSPAVDGHRPSITVFFQSLALNYGPSAMALLLTGMGRDGAIGMRTLREAGGHTIAQDKASSIVFGMPKEAIALDAAREILDLGHMGERIEQLLRKP